MRLIHHIIMILRKYQVITRHELIDERLHYYITSFLPPPNAGSFVPFTPPIHVIYSFMVPRFHALPRAYTERLRAAYRLVFVPVLPQTTRHYHGRSDKMYMT